MKGEAKFISWRGVVFIAITWFYFLIYAQFAFLERVSSCFQAPPPRAVMAAMGISGVLGSLLTPWILRRWSWRGTLRIGLCGCAFVAILTLAPINGWWWLLVATGVGLSLGLQTVTLVGHLDQLLGARSWGLKIGLGTGLAYFACNLPFIFGASPELQCAVAALMMLLACALVPSRGCSSNKAPSMARALTTLPFPTVVLIFALLIWLDSAAFFIIQTNLDLVAGTWTGASMLWRNALVHLGFATIAGWWIERRRYSVILLGAFCLLAVSACLINDPQTLWLGGALYPSGVSLYSVCLIAYPAYLLGALETGRRLKAAAILYAVAGWGGSGLGIGMAQDLHRVPLMFVVVASMAAILAAGYSWWKPRRHELGTCLVLLLLALALSSLSRPGKLAEPNGTVFRGREVYLSEGCIHCHSRYVRPQPLEVTMWGPHIDHATLLQEQPPLFGNRRQGPDLLNVGLRRSRAWLRHHFIDPQSLAPGSVMPAYAHLFRDGRGDALLDYLTQQSSASFEERIREIRKWQLSSNLSTGSADEQRKLYQKHCATCHGASGRGDGPTASQLQRSPADLLQGPFIYTADESAIPRVVKFGQIGTDMPGHEYLHDGEIAALSAYVKTLRKSAFQPTYP